MLNDIKMLVFAFDDEDGLPETVYDATSNLILHVMGEAASKVFKHYMDCTDERFYLTVAEACWKDMLDAAIRY